jgi:hypothetical protein
MVSVLGWLVGDVAEVSVFDLTLIAGVGFARV